MVRARSRPRPIFPTPVIQLDRTGCGIATVAAVAGRSYGEVKRQAWTLGIGADDPRLWSETGPVRRLLLTYGLAAGPRTQPFRSWKSLPPLALLAIKWHREGARSCWHWVVFVRRGTESFVLDSKRMLRHHRRTDFGRMKPRWYLPVRRGR